MSSAERVAEAAARYAEVLRAAEHPYTVEVSRAWRSLTAAIAAWEADRGRQLTAPGTIAIGNTTYTDARIVE